MTYHSRDLYYIAELMSEMEVDGHRADIVILKTAMAHAAFEGRTAVCDADILLAAELALPHRLKRKPFEETQSKMERLEQRLEQARCELAESEQSESDSAAGAGKKKTDAVEAEPEDSDAEPPSRCPCAATTTTSASSRPATAPTRR